jgi:DNA-binding CsgD family transcriptional regulator
MAKKSIKKSRLITNMIECLELGYSIKDMARELNLSYGYLANTLSTLYLIYDCKNSRGLLSKKDLILSHY